MRVAGLMFGAAFLVFGSAVAVTVRQDPTAEQQFKNIQSFKGQKASEVIPAMEFMCASLKTDCDYCHAEDRASDAKEAKKTAREMIAMQRDINERHFNGRNQVTCATCHGGHIRPVNLPPVVGAEVRPRRSQDVTVEQVLAAYGKATAGSESASTLRLEGTSVVVGLRPGTTQLTELYSNGKFTLENKGPKGDNRQGFNGSMAWFTTPNGIQPVPLMYAIQYVNQSIVYTGPASLPKLSNTTAGTAKLGDRDMLTVTGTTADKWRLTLYIDKQTGQLARTAYSYPTILGNMLQVNEYSDYRKVGGVEWPMTRVIHATEGDTTIHYSSARVDTSITATSFDPPSK